MRIAEGNAALKCEETFEKVSKRFVCAHFGKRTGNVDRFGTAKSVTIAV
jgi:hypothetical protein